MGFSGAKLGAILNIVISGKGFSPGKLRGVAPAMSYFIAQNYDNVEKFQRQCQNNLDVKFLLFVDFYLYILENPETVDDYLISIMPILKSQNKY